VDRKGKSEGMSVGTSSDDNAAARRVPPRTTPAAVDSIWSRMDEGRRRRRALLVGGVASALALVAVVSLLWPWSGRSSNAVDRTGKVQIEIGSSGAFGVPDSGR
jgi:hypothetical protein